MDEIVTELSKPVWWISVVVAGIIINLISSYLKTGVDFLSSKLITGWSQRNAKKAKEWNDYIDTLNRSEDFRKMEQVREFRLRLSSIHLLLLAIYVMNMPFSTAPGSWMDGKLLDLATNFLAALVFFMSLRTFAKAARKNEAQNKALINALKESASSDPNSPPKN